MNLLVVGQGVPDPLGVREWRMYRRLLGAYAYAGRQADIKISVFRHPGYALPTAIVQRAEMVTAIAASGVSQTVARYDLKTKASYLEIELPQGSRVLLLWSAANRDPETFDHPDRVDIHRPGLREHLTFGRGIHFCVGARLARLEARVILEELLGRTRSFALDPQNPPKYVSSIFVRRNAELRLTMS